MIVRLELDTRSGAGSMVYNDGCGISFDIAIRSNLAKRQEVCTSGTKKAVGLKFNMRFPAVIDDDIAVYTTELPLYLI